MRACWRCGRIAEIRSDGLCHSCREATRQPNGGVLMTRPSPDLLSRYDAAVHTCPDCDNRVLGDPRVWAVRGHLGAHREGIVSIWSSQSEGLTAYEVDYQPTTIAEIDVALNFGWNSCIRVGFMAENGRDDIDQVMLSPDQARALIAELTACIRKAENYAERGEL